MMQYFNSVTGVSIETDCTVEGGNWELVPEQEKKRKKSEKSAAENAENAENEADMK
ncbi:MAG: hypothetical protein RR900_08495 [Ruthenibacterium sp.]